MFVHQSVDHVCLKGQNKSTKQILTENQFSYLFQNTLLISAVDIRVFKTGSALLSEGPLVRKVKFWSEDPLVRRAVSPKRQYLKKILKNFEKKNKFKKKLKKKTLIKKKIKKKN